MSRNSAAIKQISSEWARIGVGFTITPYQESVDLEDLIARTVTVVRDDERLFVMAASWLAKYHYFVDARNLSRKLSTLDKTSSAVAGALLSIAAEQANDATALLAGIEHCKPLRNKVALFPLMESYPAQFEIVRRETLPVYSRWGFWHNDNILKLNALRTTKWILNNVPELRIRAIMSPGLEAILVTLLHQQPSTAMDVAKATGATYVAVHTTVNRLLGRGVISSEPAGRAKLLSLTPTTQAALAL